MIKATIKDARIYDVLDLWKRKPRQLGFNDTEVIVVTVKAGSEEIKESFFTCLKPDGTFNIRTPNRISEARRQKLASFLKYYFKIKEPEHYNLKENIKNWVGKQVEIVKGDKINYIFIP